MAPAPCPNELLQSQPPGKAKYSEKLMFLFVTDRLGILEQTQNSIRNKHSNMLKSEDLNSRVI
jgi:hypothetical protein